MAWLRLIWNMASLLPTSPPCPVQPWGEGRGKAPLTKVTSIVSDSASSCRGSQTAATGTVERGLAEESCWPRGARWLVAGWVAGRTRLRERWREWQHLSWLLWLLAREPCDSLVKRVLSTMRHFFFPLWLYLFFSEVKRKQNVPTKLSVLKLYSSPMTQGEKFKGNEEEGEHFWIRFVVLSLKGEEDFAGWRTAQLYSTVSREQRTGLKSVPYRCGLPLNLSE